jgi:hypothetical protein
MSSRCGKWRDSLQLPEEEEAHEKGNVGQVFDPNPRKSVLTLYVFAVVVPGIACVYCP